MLRTDLKQREGTESWPTTSTAGFDYDAFEIYPWIV